MIDRINTPAISDTSITLSDAVFNQEKARHEALLSRVDKEEAEEELKWSDDEEEEEETPQQTKSSEEKEERTEGNMEEKEERTITEQPVSVESSTEGTVTPEKVVFLFCLS